ncbi:post-transcriptional regulator [Planococcus shenhongbingii]|uniref:post-transcriptional regulator n=1 Tax=Planococcus shenhongbingii TaxID=3058398 RepID=UPI002634B659|nr:post-transcriptional regulator [Planococcus sp. N016]WKA60032.1 post-transcriptional regulator [Planococcus sp. N016]
MLNFTDQYDIVLPALESKCAEFHYLQYDTVTPEELWQYCIKKKWKKKNIGEMRLHEMVNDIMEMTASEFVAFHQIEGLRGANFFSEGNLAELEQLLRPTPKKPTSI